MGFTEDFLLRLNARLQDEIKSNLFHTANEVAYCQMSVEAKEKIMPVINRLREASLIPYEDDSLQADYIASLLSLFLIDTIRMGYWNVTSIEDHYTNMFQIHEKFIKAVDESFNKCHNVEDYMDMLNVSRTYLNACVQKYSKTTPLKIISDRIVREAKRTIRYGKLSIKEVALNLGFDDTSYFIRFFKKNVGMTPNEFRNVR